MKKVYRIINEKNEVIYIGITKQSLKRRLSSGYKFIPKQELRKSSIEEIEETSDYARERYWINYYKSIGCNLYNIQDGCGYDKNQWHKDNFQRMYDSYYSEYWKVYKKENREKYNEYMRNYMRGYSKNRNNKNA